MTPTEFTPVASLVGGVLIGLSAALLLLTVGRIAGISGIAGGLSTRLPRGDALWRVLFVVGLFAGGAAMAAWQPGMFQFAIERPMGAVVAAGLLVGFGSRLGGGCTSGHGVCGISRLSRRSILATVTFMAAGIATVFVTHHVLGVGA
jgi:uncharacterized protein